MFPFPPGCAGRISLHGRAPYAASADAESEPADRGASSTSNPDNAQAPCKRHIAACAAAVCEKLSINLTFIYTARWAATILRCKCNNLLPYYSQTIRVQVQREEFLL